jgi:hypothetical protein
VSFHRRSHLRLSVHLNYIKIIIKFPGLVFVSQRTQQFTLYLRVLKADISGRARRCGSAATRLLGLRVRNPPGVWVYVLCKCLCCQVEVSATGWSLVQRSPTGRGVSECDCEALIKRRPWPSKGLLRREGGGGIMKLMINIATSVCWTIFNLSAACCSEILKFLYSIQFTNFRNTCLQTASFIIDAVRTELCDWNPIIYSEVLIQCVYFDWLK